MLDTRTICAIAVGLMLGACGPDQATQLLETAQLEERQNNLDHAKQVYEDLIRLYPQTNAAETARARLGQLNSGR